MFRLHERPKLQVQLSERERLFHALNKLLVTKGEQPVVVTKQVRRKLNEPAKA